MSCGVRLRFEINGDEAQATFTIFPFITGRTAATFGV